MNTVRELDKKRSGVIYADYTQRLSSKPQEHAGATMDDNQRVLEK
jgi:hypothetical protein